MSAYNLRRLKSGYRLVKFDELLNPTNIYVMTVRGNHVDRRDCFQAHTYCRHRQMMEKFLAANAADTGRFYDFDNNRWLPAVKP